MAAWTMSCSPSSVIEVGTSTWRQITGSLLRNSMSRVAISSTRSDAVRFQAVSLLGLNPGYAQVQAEHFWSQGWMDVIQGGMTPAAAAENSFKRAAEILAKGLIMSTSILSIAGRGEGRRSLSTTTSAQLRCKFTMIREKGDLISA